ncbi:MAG: hypothetical protein D4R45_07710 [Planctomycetaceae bacterium]|nr:MAG: hypothetical protein D4R45_07710 [Planctomycetaceae bacterium]
MCFKKIFEWLKPDPVILDPINAQLALLSFGIDDYPGTQNDLDECLHDLDIARDKLIKYWPDFLIKRFEDDQVTRRFFKDQLAEALKQHWDTVIMFMDCCFSEDNTRNPGNGKVRFVPLEKKFKFRKIRKSFIRAIEMKWIAFSACQDYQTAADGCFTPLSMNELKPDITYRQWAEATKKKIAKSGFKQISEMQGPDCLLDKKVFSDKTLMIQYSGHGTYGQDYNHDEEDGQDEMMYVFDGCIVDDELSEILSVI